MSTQYRTVRLMRNRVYPTYQLFAKMANKKTHPRDGMRLGALTVLRWLCGRLGDELPEELSQIPDPSCYRELTDDRLFSLHLNEGFVIDIVFLPQKAWALQITEPDLGSDPGDPGQQRPAVPGRIIETNVAFYIAENELHCGFQTKISDPCGCTEEAEVYRLAFVRQLIRNPDFGLCQGIPFSETVKQITTEEQVKGLIRHWKGRENQLPLVIFTQPMAKEELPQDLMERLPISAPPRGSYRGLGGPVMPPTQPLKRPEEKQPYDIARFAERGVTFCHTFLAEAPVLKRLAELLKQKISLGDILILEPVLLGGRVVIIPDAGLDRSREEAFRKLQQRYYSYSRGKEIDFGRVSFLSATRETLFSDTAAMVVQSQKVSDQWQEQMERLKAEWENALREKDKENQQLTARLDRQKDFLHRLEDGKEQLINRHQQELERLNREIDRREDALAYMRRKLNQPTEHTAIEEWVKEHFPERLLLHPKAVGLLAEKSAQQVDIGLICDALDFLATDYWEYQYRQIAKEEMLTRCSQKYNRPFEIKPVGSETVEYTPKEYKIKYFLGKQGKPVESPLDHHLCVGNSPKTLLRIYFLHDDKKQLIVVGSLPRHLKSISISG